MKKIAVVLSMIFLSGAVLVSSCSDNSGSGNAGENSAASGGNEQAEVHGDLIKPEEVQAEGPLDAQMAAAGKAIYDMKCQSCHKLTDEKIVGPGWKDITKKRQPHWIMNMITNVDIMLEKDPEAQKLLEQCLVRMPNQNVSKEESRQLLEFMRQNDGVK